MGIAVHILAALGDHANYIYILRDEAEDYTVAVDPGEARPVLEFLQPRGWKLSAIWNTHHHWDHKDGNLPLKSATGCRIYGPAKERDRIPGLDEALQEGDEVPLGTARARALEIPGHTLGHMAYWLESESALFPGDTLFALGCGRLFEGTPEMMRQSLARLAQLPPHTRIYCGHEYTETNLRFALAQAPGRPDLLEYKKEISALRAQGEPTLPTLLSRELALNPFLQAREAPAEFARLRGLRDRFR
ncbi:MAG: hydroxyacylglutathione hydrolase [Bacteriovoracia bacterium]